ncbi:hypothetical protein PybrP1_004744 [[Pythium] brassicae (nom. inval.)]|nr:hypothetical protein PybrP1_004744 [[Pythium] brassicae (nom. inval.)]
MVNSGLALYLKSDVIAAFVLHPGLVATDMTNYAPGTISSDESVQDLATTISKLAFTETASSTSTMTRPFRVGAWYLLSSRSIASRSSYHHISAPKKKTFVDSLPSPTSMGTDSSFIELQVHHFNTACSHYKASNKILFLLESHVRVHSCHVELVPEPIHDRRRALRHVVLDVDDVVEKKTERRWGEVVRCEDASEQEEMDAKQTTRTDDHVAVEAECEERVLGGRVVQHAALLPKALDLGWSEASNRRSAVQCLGDKVQLPRLAGEHDLMDSTHQSHRELEDDERADSHPGGSQKVPDYPDVNARYRSASKDEVVHECRRPVDYLHVYKVALHDIAKRGRVEEQHRSGQQRLRHLAEVATRSTRERDRSQHPTRCLEADSGCNKRSVHREATARVPVAGARAPPQQPHIFRQNQHAAAHRRDCRKRDVLHHFTSPMVISYRSIRRRFSRGADSSIAAGHFCWQRVHTMLRLRV